MVRAGFHLLLLSEPPLQYLLVLFTVFGYLIGVIICKPTILSRSILDFCHCQFYNFPFIKIGDDKPLSPKWGITMGIFYSKINNRIKSHVSKYFQVGRIDLGGWCMKLGNHFVQWRLIIPFLILIVAVLAVLLIFVPKTYAAPQQPIAFNHQAMANKDIGCLFCHMDARQSPAAGMPSIATCMGCHSVITVNNSPIIKQLADYWQRQQPIPWVRVNVLPRFVYFNHEVHVNAGQSCENCHGDVAHMTVDRPVVRMNMAWCLNCHEKQKDAPQLIDCVICHR